MKKYPRVLLVTVGLTLAVVAGVVNGISQGPAYSQKLPAAIYTPLNSTLPNPSQLDSCVDKAIAYTQASYPPTDGKVGIALKRQVTDKTFAQAAPKAKARTPDFGVLMNLVVVQGHFTIPARFPGSKSKTTDRILYVLTPYPDCLVTVVTWGETTEDIQ